MAYLDDMSILDSIPTYLDEQMAYDAKGVYSGVDKLKESKKSDTTHKRCYLCGKEFRIRMGQFERYVYKDFCRGKKRWYCSWTCLSRSRKAREKNE